MLCTECDFEIAEFCRGHISKICDAMKTVNEIVAGFQRFLLKISDLPTRKDKAQAILQAYGTTNRSGMVFSLLDDKPLSKDELKKLLYQVLKN